MSGCGKTRTFGKGLIATCGEHWLTGKVWLCEDCLADTLQEVLTTLEELHNLCDLDYYNYRKLHISGEIEGLLAELKDD